MKQATEYTDDYEIRRRKQTGSNFPLRRAYIVRESDLNAAGRVEYSRSGTKNLDFLKHFDQKVLGHYVEESESPYTLAGFIIFWKSPSEFKILKDITRGLGEPLSCACP